MAAFDAVTGANTNSTLQKIEEVEAPRLAAHNDAIYLDSHLFARVAAIYQQRDPLKLDPESQRLLEITYKKFVHAGANLSDSDKAKLKKLNEEESTLSNAFKNKLLAATRKTSIWGNRRVFGRMLLTIVLATFGARYYWDQGQVLDHDRKSQVARDGYVTF